MGSRCTSPLPGGGNKGGASVCKNRKDGAVFFGGSKPPPYEMRWEHPRRVILSAVELLRPRKSAELARRNLGGHYARLPIGHTISFTRPRAVGAPRAGRKVRLRYRSAQGDTIGRCICSRIAAGVNPRPTRDGGGTHLLPSICQHGQ